MILRIIQSEAAVIITEQQKLLTNRLTSKYRKEDRKKMKLPTAVRWSFQNPEKLKETSTLP